MKFKENAIKPGMVIHCLNENEKDTCFGYLMERDDLDFTYTNPEDEVGWFFFVYDRMGKPEDMSEEITEFSDLIEPENSTGGEKLTDTSTGMTNQRAIEILSDYIERNEHIIHDPGTEAIRIATSALVEKEANKNTEKVNVLMDEYKQAKKPDEMSAAEVLEWLKYAGKSTLVSLFGTVFCDEILLNNTSQEIVDKITAYEAAKKEKPVELEWVKILRIIQIQENGFEKVVCEEETNSYAIYRTDEEGVYCFDPKYAAEGLLKKYISKHEGRYIAVIEDVCRVKGE